MNSEQTMEMNSEQTTEEEFTLENYDHDFIRLCDFFYEMMTTSYIDVDDIISQVQPDFVTTRGGSNAVPVEPNYGTIEVGERTYAGIMGARGLPIQFIGAVGVELNDVRAYYNYIRAAAHFRRSTFGAGSGYINETMSAEASPGGGDGLGVEWNDNMLTALRSTARAIREQGGFQDLLIDEAGGRFLVIHIHPPQQGDEGLVEAARGTQDGPGDLARRALPSVIGGLVPLCFNLLLDDNILKAGGSPGYIKAAAYTGLGLVTVFTFLGLASKKRAKAAVRVVASTSTAAVSIAVVYQVSDNAYIKCFCGIMGCVATLATMAIDW